MARTYEKDEFKVYINDFEKEFEFIQGLTFTASIGSVITSFAIQTTLDAWGFAYLDDVVKIRHKGEEIFTGVIESDTYIDSNKESTSTYKGRNKIGVLLDSHLKPTKYTNKSITEIISESLEEIGADIEIIIPEDQIVSTKKVPLGKSLGQLIAELAGEFGLYLWCDGGGRIVLGHPAGGVEAVDEFDFTKGVAGDISFTRDITNSASEVIVQHNIGGGSSATSGIFKTRKKKTKKDFLELFGVQGTQGGGKTYKKFDSTNFEETYSTGAYKVLGTLGNPPQGGLNIDRTKYLKLNTASEVNVDIQYRQVLEKFFPTFEITINLQYPFYPQLNTIYKIKNERMNMDGFFLLKSYQISLDSNSPGSTVLKFSLPAHL